ncbi:class I SAM-dependent methyltransferase [Actinacidiphila rubida]|uniref:class I SAM-dependent methyltransferase n=2 Tax=Actinacidiphila rubida TaxID=310780 RepID=UPI000B2B8CF3|nr:class I SAM-dependent methyltransferase [Actinacidiphila rubida]
MDGTPMDENRLLAEQMAYYRERASTYDRPYEESAALRALLTVVDELPVGGDVLELACGTGQWTSRLASLARSVTALDASAEVLEIARTRAASPTVDFVQADLFRWRPPRRYDAVFFAFWLSHVPPARLPAFWSSVAAALAPGGRAVFVDDGPLAAEGEEILADPAVPTAVRSLDNGDRYRIVKVFHDRDTLSRDLTALGWTPAIRTLGSQYVGTAEPPAAR